MALPDRIVLADHEKRLTEAWSQAFAKFDNFLVHDGDFFAHDGDQVSGPARIPSFQSIHELHRVLRSAV